MSIHQLIAEHRLHWEACRVILSPEERADAEEAKQEALFVLCNTPVTSYADVTALLRHLEWYAEKEGEAEEELPRALRAALYWGCSAGITMGIDMGLRA